MPQESISTTRNGLQESRPLSHDRKTPSQQNGEIALADDRQVNIGELYGCLCHQAPTGFPIPLFEPADKN
jgi:hypothetical protein